LKDFVSELATKMMIALEIPIIKELHKDIQLLRCINIYGSKTLEKRREKALFFTFLALMNCKNRYEDVLIKLNEITTDFGHKSVNVKKPRTIQTYRSNIVNKYLKFHKEDLPECAFKWKEKVIHNLED